MHQIYILKISLNANVPSKISLLFYESTPFLFNNYHFETNPSILVSQITSSLFIFKDLKVCK